MGTLEDIRKWLKEIPLWQELGEIPAKMSALEARVAALEERLKTRPGETCPKCGEHTMRLESAGRMMGSQGKEYRNDDWACTSPGCDYTEERIFRP